MLGFATYELKFVKTNTYVFKTCVPRLPVRQTSDIPKFSHYLHGDMVGKLTRQLCIAIVKPLGS